MPSIDDLIALGRQRWLVLLMAEMQARRGARFVELLNATGIARESLIRTIELALELGWIARNSGHGHPLRPEYVLTSEGRAIGQVAARIAGALTRLGIDPTGLTRWSLALLHALGAGVDRFSALSRLLAPATPRALSQGLKALAANDLVDREVEEGFPPTSRYRLTGKGVEFTRLGFNAR
jgi:DNA-binding HxlR family transcriptional regulator